jgi:hypothetical protein
MVLAALRERIPQSAWAGVVDRSRQPYARGKIPATTVRAVPIDHKDPCCSSAVDRHRVTTALRLETGAGDLRRLAGEPPPPPARLSRLRFGPRPPSEWRRQSTAAAFLHRVFTIAVKPTSDRPSDTQMEDANTKTSAGGSIECPHDVQPDRGRIDFSATFGNSPRPVSNTIPSFPCTVLSYVVTRSSAGLIIGSTDRWGGNRNAETYQSSR